MKEELSKAREIIDKGLVVKLDVDKARELLSLIEKETGKCKEFYDFRSKFSKNFRWSPKLQNKFKECFNVQRVEKTDIVVPMGHELAKTGRILITDDEVWFTMSPAYHPEVDTGEYYRYVRAFIGKFGDRTLAMRVLNRLIN